MNNEKISGFKRNHAGGDEKLVVNKCWPLGYKLRSGYSSGSLRFNFRLGLGVRLGLG